MATHFGADDSTPDNIDFLASRGYSYWRSSGYTCPGSGNQTVKELSTYCVLQSGSANIRLAIYSGTTLVGYGTDQVPTTTTAGWQGHLSEATVQAVGGGSCTLTGGSTYILVLSDDQAALYLYYGYNNSVTNGVTLHSAEWTGGFPSTLPSPDTGTFDYEWCIRCGVDPAAGPSLPPVFFRRRHLSTLFRLCLSTFTSLFGRLVYALR